MTKAELIEKLADIEHQSWSRWQEWVHKNGITLRMGNTKTPRETGYLAIPDETIAHWKTLIATDYADLPEHSKQADRDEVMKAWPLFVEFAAEWMAREGGRYGVLEPDLDAMVAAWRGVSE